MQDEMIAQALEAKKAFLANEELMSEYEWAEKDRLDREAHQQYWEDKGRAEGREGVAKNLISMHLPDEMIIKATGLSAEVVASLHASHAQKQ